MEKDRFPRPDFIRTNWKDLNGEWEFAFDEERDLEEARWVTEGRFPRKIQVPFVYQTKRSGIGDNAMHEVVWYRRTLELPPEMEGRQIRLVFGAVDYRADVWLNGVHIGGHTGGYTPFDFWISGLLREGANELVVRAQDRQDTAQPRGKQYWKQEPDRCWYVQNTGIWQNVWLEAAQGAHIDQIKLTPDIDTNSVEAVLTVEDFCAGDCAEVQVFYQERTVKRLTVSLDGIRTRIPVGLQPEDAIDEMHYWSPESPSLYDVRVTLLRDQKPQDCVETYFGMRKISIDRGEVRLNYRPYYMKLVLDQGYWRESGLTPPDAEALRRDVEMTKALGFNGARKHQKIEDSRYYYWADRLGLIVWGEVPSAYEYCDQEVTNLFRDFGEFIRRDYNHPSIVAWVPLNESWGVRKIVNDFCQQNFASALYHFAKSMDPMRLVSGNDGWEMAATDIAAVHDYHKDGEDFDQTYTPEALEQMESMAPTGRRLFAYGMRRPRESALMITEYGGIALAVDAGGKNWGYGKAEESAESLIARYRDVTEAIMRIPGCRGFCYTQLTDVYQEVNGLLDMDHRPKFDCGRIREINDLR